MTTEKYFEILKKKYEELNIGNRPTKEELHEYNQFKQELRKELYR